MKLYELIQLLASATNDPNTEVVLETKEGDEIDIDDVQFKRGYYYGRVVIESKSIVLRSTYEETLKELSDANEKICQLENELERHNAQ
jgi:hypothetical protein